MAYNPTQEDEGQYHRYTVDVKATIEEVAKLSSDLLKGKGPSLLLRATRLVVHSAIQPSTLKGTPLEFGEKIYERPGRTISARSLNLTLKYCLGDDDWTMQLVPAEASSSSHQLIARGGATSGPHLQLSGGTIQVDPTTSTRVADIPYRSSDPFDNLWKQPASLPSDGVLDLYSDHYRWLEGSLVLMDVELPQTIGP